MESVAEIIKDNPKIKDKTEGKLRSLKNLRPYEKGDKWKGNKNGRPLGSVSVTEAIKAKLQEVYPEKDGSKNKEKKLYLHKLVEAIMKNALENGESRTQKDIWAYMDGQPKATIDIGADKESLGELTEFFRAIAKKKK